MDLQSMKAAMEARRPVVAMEVEELGGKVLLKPLDARAGIGIASKFGGMGESDTAGQVATFVELIVASVVDEDGTTILDSDEGREFVNSWGPGLVMRIGQKSAEINGLTGKN